MSNKNAFELSLNFIVVLIISIVIFGFGVKFINDLSSAAVDLTKLTESQLDERIGNIICESSERVCVGVDKKIISKKKFDVFGLDIINILEPPPSKSGQNFDITVLPSNPIGFTKNKNPITGPPLIINPSGKLSKFIAQNNEKNIGIGIQVPQNAVSGTYIFNVEIDTEIKQSDGTYKYMPYSQIIKLYVDVS